MFLGHAANLPQEMRLLWQLHPLQVFKVRGAPMPPLLRAAPACCFRRGGAAIVSLSHLPI